MTLSHFDERGVLTDSNIAFLKGEKDYSSARRSGARQEIRHRVAAALYDFEILLEHWPVEQRKGMVEDIETESPADIEELGSAIVGLLYALTNHENTEVSIVKEENPTDQFLRFRRAVTKGIQRGKMEFGHEPEPVSIATTTHLHETPDVETVRQDLDMRISNEILSKMREKYLQSMLYEEPSDVIDNNDQIADLEEAIELLYIEWFERIVHDVSTHRRRTGDFKIPCPVERKTAA